MPQAGYVYIMHGIGTDIIKVGKTTSILKRLREVDQGVPFVMQLVRVELVHDMDKRENELKALYRLYNIKGEWFKLPAHLLAQWPLDDNGLPPLVPPLEASRPKGYQTQMAKEWLHTFLENGPMASIAILAAAQAVGIAKKTLRRAKAALRIEAFKEGHAWQWQLNQHKSAIEDTLIPQEPLP